MVIEISSDSRIDINHHFRVSAGPGAGKTHWLSLACVPCTERLRKSWEDG